MNPSCGLSTLITKVISLSALDISCAVSVVVFALDSPERETREGSTTPCGVKGVVGPGSRTQPRLAAEKTECPLQRWGAKYGYGPKQIISETGTLRSETFIFRNIVP